jgi:hypothetical protein
MGYNEWKQQLSGMFSSATGPVSSAAPGVTTDQGATSLFGTAPEGKGRTVTGGRRHRSRKSKKSRKTRRRH